MGLTRRFVMAAGSCLAATSARAREDVPGQWPRPKTPWDDVAALAHAAVSGKLTPGVSIAALRDGRIVQAAGYGFADLENPAPMRADSICRIGSITKQFTAAAILKLAEAGKLSVQDTVARFYPDFPRGGEITIRQVLTHTSGLGNYTHTDPPDAFIQNARRDYNDTDMLQVLLAARPLFVSAPGAAFAYSNSGYVLLGLIVAKVSGQSYHDYMQATLFAPLGLKSTAVDDMAALVPGRADGYSPDPFSPAGFDNASFISMTYPGGAGSIRSTAADLCRWADALLWGRVLKPASLADMLTPGRLANGQLPVSGGQHDRARTVYYGFGVIVEKKAGKQVVAHNGGIQGFMSLLRSVVEDRVSVAVLCNSDGADEAHALADAMDGIADAAMRAVHA